MPKPSRTTKKSASQSAYSAGAREERREVLAYLRRRLKSANLPSVVAVLNSVIGYVETRQKRYSKKKGGL